jgi:ribosomal-protein-alanine N-acetyltransferase
LQLRRYRTTDLDAIVALDAICFAEEFVFGSDSMQRFAEAENAVTVLAEVDGVLAGFVIAQVERRTGQSRGYIVTLDVAPAYRRAGVAGRLMEAVESAATAAENSWMSLHVFTENAAAIRFYESRGYGRRGLQRGFYGVGMDAYLYRKALRR